jgi:transporter family protein
MLFIALSVLGFGIWGLLMKMGQQRLGPTPHLITMGIVIAVLVIVGLAARIVEFPLLGMNTWIAVAATLATLVAMGSFVWALESAKGNTVGVVALTALYPGVTAVLATVFLGESFSVSKGAGLLLAFSAAYLFSR